MGREGGGKGVYVCIFVCMKRRNYSKERMEEKEREGEGRKRKE